MSLAQPGSIIIYREPRSLTLDAEQVAAYLAGLMPQAVIDVRGPLLEDSIGRLAGEERVRLLEKTASALAAARVRDPMAPDGRMGKKSLPGEIDYERRRLENPGSKVFGILYDGFGLAELCRQLIAREEQKLGNIHIIFTNQLIGTWEEADKRYHARTVICGQPAIISLAGLVEAPAKDRGYYLARRSSEMLGLAEEEKMELAREFAGDSLEHDDPRLNEVVKGYVMQAIAFWRLGWPFCEDPGCRLYNAHWQKELLEAQLGSGAEYCNYHREAFSR